MWLSIETKAALLIVIASPELGVHSVTTDYNLFFFSIQPSVLQPHSQSTRYCLVFRAASERHTVPPFLVTGLGDVLQGVAQALHGVVGSIQF